MNKVCLSMTNNNAENLICMIMLAICCKNLERNIANLAKSHLPKRVPKAFLEG